MPPSIFNDLNLDVSGIDEALSERRAIPPRLYVDAGAFEFEMEHIWERNWVIAGPSGLLEQPGARLVCDIGRVPVVVVRGADDELRAFVNTCRHRGYPVVRDERCRQTLQCGYHAWTYDLDGSLRKAPGSELEPDFDKSDLSLIPVAVAESCGSVFVNVDVDARPFHEMFPDFERLARERDVDLTRYRYVGRVVSEVACNWKLWLHNFNECYHCPTVHPKTLMSAYVTYNIEDTFDDGLMIQHERALDDGLPSDSFQLFPGSMVLQDRGVGFLGAIVPTGPTSCRYVSYNFVNPELDDKTASDWLEMWNRTISEDAEVVSVQQPGFFAYRKFAEERVMPASEAQVWSIHELVWNAYRDALKLAV